MKHSTSPSLVEKIIKKSIFVKTGNGMKWQKRSEIELQNTTNTARFIST